MTLLRDWNGIYWFSPFDWNDPHCGRAAQPDEWEYLGEPGWAIEQRHHDRRKEVFELFGNPSPFWPGEFMTIKEQKQ